jgi:hypothetical protein
VGVGSSYLRWPAQRPADSAVSSPRGDARWTSAKRQGGPDPPETKVGVSFLNSAYPFCGAMIREQLAIATVAFAISFVAITEVLLSLM